MKRLARALLIVALSAAPAWAAGPLNMTKSMRTVSDPVNAANPHNIPGAVIDYTINVQNPLLNGGAPSPTFVDSIPANTELRVDDLPLLSAVSIIGGVPVVSDLTTVAAGPVDYQGSTALNGLTYTFSGLASEDDSIDFSSDNRQNWDYHPVRGASGYDPRVTDIRIRFTTTQRANSSYSVRFRVRVR